MDVDMAGLNSMIEAAGEEAPAPAAPEAPAAPAAPEGVVEPVEAGGAEPDTFDRKYVEELRKEAAKYRTKAKEFEAFESYSDEDRQVWATLAQTLLDDPKAAAKYMKDIADHLLGDGTEETEDSGAEPEYLTVQKFEQMQKEADTAKKVQKIESDARGMGYDTDSTDYMHLLMVANRETAGDIRAAHDRIEAQKQSWIDNFVAQKAKEAEGSPGVAGSSGFAPAQGTEIKDFKTAQAAMLEMLKAQ